METSKYNSVLSGKNFDISARKRDQSAMTSSYQPTYYQSTPKGKTSMSSPLMNGSITRSPTSAGRRSSPSSVSRRSASPLRSQSTSPTKLHHGTSLASPRQLLDVDTDTIQKQRRELQLLIMELKDRDRELNDTVHAHQKHLQSWDEDRQRILSLERRCARLEGELKTRNEQCKALSTRLKSTEAEEMNKRKELETTMEQLKEAAEQAEIATQQLEDLEDKNTNLSDSLRELSNNLGQLQAREQELLTKMKLKENDITEANIRIGEFQQKTRRLENALQEYQTVEKALRAERDQFRDQHHATKNEVENLRGEMSKQFSDADDLQSELAQAKQDVLVLQKEVFLAGEREKRKDQLLELQKSKQERTDSELQHLRQICERQQRDISYMQMHLQTSQETFLKNETRDERFYDLENKTATNSHLEWLNNTTEIQGSGFPSLQSSSPLKDTIRDFNNLSFKDPDHGLNAPMSYLPDTKQRSSTNNSDNHTIEQQIHRNLGSPELTSESEQFIPLPTFSAAQTFPLTNFEGQTTNGEHPNDDTTLQPRDDEDSPTSKLHRLLAESRQMVQTLENSTMTTPPTGSVDGSETFSPSSTSPNTDRLTN